MRNIEHSLALLLSILIFFGGFYIASAQVPTITSFSPTSGPIGTSVTITGTNFSTTIANNIVYFGAVRVPQSGMTSATSTSLTVTVPIGTTYSPITVTVNGLTAFSTAPFIVTIAGDLNAGTNVAIGAGYAGGILSGMVDEVRISKIARSPNEFNLQLPPKNLTASASSTTINLSWQNGGGAVPLMRYKIYRGADSTNVTLIDSTTATSYQNAGLSPATTYYFRISAVDSTGFEGAKSYAASAITGTVGSAPIVATSAATDVGSTSASAGGSVNPNGLSTTAYFEWGTSSTLATFTATSSQSIGSGTSAVSVTGSLTGLIASTTYYYRAVGQNSAGTQRGTIVSFITSAIVTPATYYVNATTGSNTTGNGSQASPWKTITYALSQIVGTGNTLNVAAGTYNRALGETFPIFMADGVSLVGAGIDRSIIDAGTTQTAVKCVGIVDSTTRLDGFTITNGTSPGESGIYISAGSTLQVSYNKITASGGNTAYNFWQGGIYVVNSSPLITSNIISGNSGSGIFVSNCSPTIKNNLITGNEGNSYRGGGLTIEGSTSSPTISYNIIVNNSLEGIRCNNSSRPQIINNTIAGNSAGGIQMGGFAKGSASPDIINNIIAFNTGYGINEDVASVPGRVWYNLFQANSSGLYRDGGTTDYYTVSSLNSSVAECKNNIAGDPLFVDRSNGDYHLRTGSPAIDAGDPNSPLDPDGTRADIGAIPYLRIAPSAPTLSSPANGATNQPTTVSLSWTASTGAATYRLQISTRNDFTTMFFDDSTITTTSHTVSGLANNTNYFWRVTAKNATGTSAYSGTFSFTTVVAAPAAPTLASPANGATNQATTLTLTWNASTGAVTYRLQVSTSSAFTSTTVFDDSTLTSTSRQVGPLANNATYYWRVNAKNAGGTSPWSWTWSFSTQATVTPNPPTLTTPADAATGLNTRPLLAWTSAGAGSTYRLQVSLNSQFSTTVFDDSTVAAPSRQIGPLANNRTYYWRVSAKNPTGQSAFSATRSFKTFSAPSATSISIRSSFTSPGSRPRGLAWDGQSLWMIDNLENIYKLDTLGKVLKTFRGPRFPDSDLSWDGTGLWIGGGASTAPYDHLKIDSLGNRLDSLDAYYWSNSGIEWDGNFFWIGDYNFSIIHKHSRDGKELMNWSAGAIFGHPTGISYDGANLWIGTSAEGFTKDIFKFSTTGQTLYKFNLQNLGLNPTPGSFASVAWDGQTLWYASDDQFTIYRLDVPYYHSAPPVPALSSPSNGATGQATTLTLAWSESMDAFTYRLQVSTSSSFSTLFYDDSTLTSTSIEVKGLSGGLTYYWRVRAKNSGGTSTYSSSFSFTTSVATAAPTVTTNQATNVSATSAQLNGTVNPNGQNSTAWFEYSTDSGLIPSSTTPTKQVLAASSDIVFSDGITGLSTGTTYYYRLAAQNSGGIQRGSIRSFITIPSPPILELPANGATGELLSITFSWKASTGATAYRLQISTSNSFTSFFLDDSTITDTRRQVTSFLNNTTYYWRVGAKNTSGTSEYSGIFSLTTVAAGLAAPTLSSPANGATGVSTNPTLSWSAVSGATTYRLQVSTSSGFAMTVVDDSTLTATSRQVGPLANNTTYYWRVNAKNAGGTSSFTSTWSFSTLSTATVTTASPISFPSSPTSSTDYRLFSMPGTSSITVGDIVSGTQKTDWKMFRDNGAASSFLVELSPSSSLTPGEGYWLLKKGSLTVSRSVSMPALSSDGTYSIPLRSGWNIIGNPFDRSVSWTAILAANAPFSTAAQLWDYSGSYGSASTLEPFRGYYFDNRTANLTSLKIPYPFGLQKMQKSDLPPADWRIQLVFESDINTDPENYIGIAPSAKDDLDEWDSRKPPLFMDQGFLYFSRPTWDAEYSRFSSDYRPSLGNGQTWDFEVSNPRLSVGKIRIQGLEKIPSEYSVILINSFNTEPFDLRASNTYLYQTVSERMAFRLIVGRKDFVENETALLLPDEYELAQNFPNPFNGSTSISIKLPSDANIRLEVYSLLGQHIRTLAAGAIRAGVHTFVWEGTDQSNSGVTSGVYFCQLSVDASLVKSKSMVFVK